MHYTNRHGHMQTYKKSEDKKELQKEKRREKNMPKKIGL